MKVRYYHDSLGFNFRMTDLARGDRDRSSSRSCRPSTPGAKRTPAGTTSSWPACPALITPAVFPQRTHVYHQYTVRITPEFGKSRDALAEALTQRGISTGIYYPIPVHQQEAARAQAWAAAHSRWPSA